VECEWLSLYELLPVPKPCPVLPSFKTELEVMLKRVVLPCFSCYCLYLRLLLLKSAFKRSSKERSMRLSSTYLGWLSLALYFSSMADTSMILVSMSSSSWYFYFLLPPFSTLSDCDCDCWSSEMMDWLS